MRTLMALERIGEVTLVKITRDRLLDEEVIEALGKQLFSLLEDPGCRNLVLDFATVERMASLMAGKIGALHRRAETAGGRIALCRVRPGIHEIFVILKMTRFLNIYREEQLALQSFSVRCPEASAQEA